MSFAPPSPPVVGGVPKKHSGRNNHPIDHVVIHSAVMPCEPGRARQLAKMNIEGTGGGSWHYATDPDETIQCSWDSYVCWAAPPNPHKIHIEMADFPGPVPGDPVGSARYKAARQAWRWVKPNQIKMLHRTARLTAELCLAYDLPPRFRSAAALKAGKRGVTTHAEVSKAFKQSTHWDPGFWPRYRFMFLVRWYATDIRRKAAKKK